MTSTFRIDDLSATSVPEAVILAVAEAADVDPLDIPPLGESLNPIALELLVDDDSFSGDVTFQFGAYEVTVSSDDVITITQ